MISVAAATLYTKTSGMIFYFVKTYLMLKMRLNL